MKKKLILGISIIIVSISACFIVGSMYFIVGAIKRNPPVLVKEDAEYLYYKSYTLYNKDSCINKYHKPIVYEGVVIDKNSHRRRRGKHWHRVYRIVIRYNNSEEHIVNGWDYYSKHRIGDKVRVQKTFYPVLEIKAIN